MQVYLMSISNFGLEFDFFFLNYKKGILNKLMLILSYYLLRAIIKSGRYKLKLFKKKKSYQYLEFDFNAKSIVT